MLFDKISYIDRPTCSDRFLRGGGVNVLTQPAFDPLSRQPELKQAAIRIEPVSLPWEVFVLIEGEIQSRFTQLRALCEPLAYASFSLTGRERPALLMRAAHDQAQPAAWLEKVDAALGLDQGSALSYEDPDHATSKRIRINDDRVTAIRLCGETRAQNWLHSLWQSGESVAEIRRWLLSPLAAPPGGSVGKVEKVVCNCMNVSLCKVQSGIDAGMDLQTLKTELGCGTQCGSCLPEIRRLIARVGETA